MPEAIRSLRATCLVYVRSPLAVETTRTNRRRGRPTIRADGFARGRRERALVEAQLEQEAVGLADLGAGRKPRIAMICSPSRSGRTAASSSCSASAAMRCLEVVVGEAETVAPCAGCAS